jgi:hypothetical protein
MGEGYATDGWDQYADKDPELPGSGSQPETVRFSIENVTQQPPIKPCTHHGHKQ